MRDPRKRAAAAVVGLCVAALLLSFAGVSVLVGEPAGLLPIIIGVVGLVVGSAVLIRLHRQGLLGNGKGAAEEEADAQRALSEHRVRYSRTDDVRSGF